MSDEQRTYSFLPWLRQGIANQIVGDDLDAAVRMRASIDVRLKIDGKGVAGPDLSVTVAKEVALYGPGDVIGIDSKAIVAVEPRHWTTNFEPNYLPYIDFYDEDFPWRYTPAAPDGGRHRLRPWLTLVVLAEEEFAETLPCIQVADATASFPPAEQLWAWAHVHVDRDISGRTDHVVSNDRSAVLSALEALLDANPDLAHARLLCPRKLDQRTAYHAFLVPTFETGRLAGLGLNPEEAPAEVHATFSAWQPYDGRPEPALFPVYYRWYFRTGSSGDFEYLVRLLKPRPMDTRVGRRDLDVRTPAINIAGIDDAHLGGILKLGGALKVPFAALDEDARTEVTRFDHWDDPYPHAFQRDLAAFINLSDAYARQPALQANRDANIGHALETLPDADPLITAPLYGRWHASMERLLTERDGSLQVPNRNWLHQLNLDPRWRVAAGLGTKVVQQNQEAYMDAAWDQIGDVLEANRRIRLAQMARAVGGVWHRKHLLPLLAARPEKALLLTAPVQRRVVVAGSTVAHHIDRGTLTAAATSPVLRRLLRRSGRSIQRLPFDERARPDNLLERINSGEVAAAPLPTVPATLPTLVDAAAALRPPGVPRPLQDALRDQPWLAYLPLSLALLLLLIMFLLGLGVLVMSLVATLAAAMVFLFSRLLRWRRQIAEAESILEENQTPAAVDELPMSPDFRVTEPGSGFTPARGPGDSPEGTRFKAALRDVYDFLQRARAAGTKPQRRPVDLQLMGEATLHAIDPEFTLPRLVLNQILIPARIFDQIGEHFTEAMAYPEIDLPMYEPLVALSSEFFLPNITHVPQDSISLLETNQPFIESYMVGLNHEFARELLWREYPTDQRGSYFRQFWDARGYLDREGLDEEVLREKLRDIPPLHRWSRFSRLGEHDHRESDTAEEVVLVIRGELLKRYPNAVIYAHRARWQLTGDGAIDNTRVRELDESGAAGFKTPLYEAKVDPDITFFGFDLTASAARGGTGEHPGDDPGWFIVIKERPGEPRFGLDVERRGDLNLWSDLAWDDLLPGPAGQHLQITPATRPLSLNARGGAFASPEQRQQYEEDRHLRWQGDMNAAEVAYILYQVPVLVAVHAAEMLPQADR